LLARKDTFKLYYVTLVRFPKLAELNQAIMITNFAFVFIIRKHKVNFRL